MARQYFVEKGEGQRRHIIARRQSYHGNTLGALATGGNEWRRAQFRPLLIETHHIDPCYAYRLQEAGESDADYAARAAQALEDKILELGPDQVIAFVAETVVGATLGAVPPVADYFKRIRSICDRYGVLLILDEVMCGMGRTGTLHACEQDGIAPDLMAIAKGLGGGYQPVGAVLLQRRNLRRPSRRAPASFSTATLTWAIRWRPPPASPCRRSSAATACWTMSSPWATICGAGWKSGSPTIHHVGDIRGRGLFRAVELVADRATKATVRAAVEAATRRSSARRWRAA